MRLVYYPGKTQVATIGPTTSSRQQAPTKKTPKTYQRHPPLGFLVLMSRCAEAKGSHLTGTSESDTLATDLSGKFPGTWWDGFFGMRDILSKKHGENGSETTNGAKLCGF